MKKLFRKPVFVVGLVVVVAGLVAGAVLFEPWRLFTSSHLDEPLPVAASHAPAEKSGTAPAKPTVLATGRFVSQEHDTAGTARVLELPDGSRVLRLEDFSTSDGPDVHVWLSTTRAGAEWGAYDDGRHVALGELKATEGNHNYEIPADAKLDGLHSTVIWCDRFDVAFGSAQLDL